jgi:hypothetical protein
VSSATREIDRIVTWRPATVSEVIRETPSASTLVLDVEGWPGHRAGQHVDIRLTAEDGYHAQRSYSLASAPEDGVATITVERLDDGEVSPYLVDDAQAGDVVEIRGPVGGWFVWETTEGGPLWLIGGGSARRDLPRRAPIMGRHVHVYARDAAGLDRLRPSRRPRDAGRVGLRARRAPADLRLRADGLRRGRRGRSDAARARPGARPD